MHSDPYTILGVSKTASQEEIRRAYRKKSLELHPDKNRGDEESTKRFQELSDAYRKLDTPEKKKQYDRTSSGLFTGEFGVDVETFFKNFMQRSFKWDMFIAAHQNKIIPMFINQGFTS